MVKRGYGFQVNFVAGTFFGLCLGVFLSTWCRDRFIPCAPSFTRTKCCLQVNLNIAIQNAEPASQRLALPEPQQTTRKPNVFIEESDEKGFIFIGVMTARKYVDSRVVAAYNTWARSINGKVMFFSSENSTASFDVPVVSLKHVDDSYPPQKKSFMMLKYMRDHALGKYEWFMRADDDVFIKGEKLERFLRSVNSSKPQFIGQAGVGTKDEIGLLNLGADENYCMGGPGVVFSHETLRRISPHLGYCVNNMYTTHEDVEVGRCVRMFAGVPCTWAFEMQKIFYQNFKEDKGAFINTLKDREVYRSVTLHPIKVPSHQYRVSNHLSSYNIQELYQKKLHLQREVTSMNHILNEQNPRGGKSKYGLLPSLMKYVPSSERDILTWEYISKTVSSQFSVNPKKGYSSALKSAVEDIITQVMFLINQNSQQKGRTIDFKELLYGYKRTNPLQGIDYIIDILLTYRKHRGKKMTVPVRRHAYVQQTFTETQFTLDPLTCSYHESNLLTSPHIFHHFRGSTPRLAQPIKMSEAIHFILPLAGKVKVFARFMNTYEDICLKPKDKCVLHVVLFSHNSPEEEVEEILKITGQYQNKYGGTNIEIIEADGAFARAKALDLGAKQCAASDLLFFVDVDIVINPDSLTRIRLNTIEGVQLYYPIVFSQYDPATVCGNVSQNLCRINERDFSPRMGYWRQFGYGIAAMYRRDLDAVGGFDVSIQGWGKEDVDLFDKFTNSNLTIFRAVDTGLVHAFHPVICDVHIDSAQFQMCIGSKATVLGSQRQLAEQVLKNNNLLNRDTSTRS